MCHSAHCHLQAHIVRTLTAVKSLRTVRLNLDFHDDHQAYCGNPEKRKRWRDTFIEQRGPEILAIMQECPLLEHVALLYHGTSSATWVEFRTPRCPGPRVVLEYDPEHVYVRTSHLCRLSSRIDRPRFQGFGDLDEEEMDPGVTATFSRTSRSVAAGTTVGGQP